MKEVNFVLYFGANRGKNALNNPQTVTTHANGDAVTREKENLLKAIYDYLIELSDMGISYGRHVLSSFANLLYSVPNNLSRTYCLCETFGK